MPQARDHNETDPLLRSASDNGAQSTTQGLSTNLLTGAALVSQAGIWIITALVWSAVFEADFSFFSYHPLLNTAGFLVMTQAILVLQPVSQQKQKIAGAYVHSAINTVGVGLLVAGLVVIEMNKADHPETRFQSTHGKIGLAVYILMAVQVLAGSAAFYLPSLFGSVDNAKSLYKYHRMSGYLIVVLMLFTVVWATQTGFNDNVLHMRVWPLTVAAVVLAVGLLARINVMKFGLAGRQ